MPTSLSVFASSPLSHFSLKMGRSTRLQVDHVKIVSCPTRRRWPISPSTRTSPPPSSSHHTHSQSPTPLRSSSPLLLRQLSICSPATSLSCPSLHRPSPPLPRSMGIQPPADHLERSRRGLFLTESGNDRSSATWCGSMGW